VIGAPPSGIGREGSPIPFDANSSSDPEGDTLHFSWSFGDGATYNTDARAIDHRYRNNGSYPLQLIVSDQHGLADTASMTFIVANVEPIITVFDYPDTVVAGRPVQIDIEYADPGVDDTVTVTFCIGSSGGGVCTSPIEPGIVTTPFYTPGEYTLSLIAEDNDGAMVYRPGDHPLIVIPAPGAGTVAMGRRP